MELTARIFVAGHRGLVGSALCRCLTKAGYLNVITISRDELDLRDQRAVRSWFEAHRPTHVFLAAGTVGGILANTRYPAEFIYDNLMIHANVVHAAHMCSVSKLLYLGSSCIYPRDSPQPISEQMLLTGPLESTNEPYAVAKIAGVKLCQAYRRQYGDCYISAMPTNLYGPMDNFELETAHVLPAMMRRFHEAKTDNRHDVLVWGSGNPRREFLHVDDLAHACIFLMESYDDEAPINIGTGEDLSIRELAIVMKSIVHPAARVEFDTTMADGSPRKLLDVSRIHSLGWRHRVSLIEGIKQTYDWFLSSSTFRRAPHYKSCTVSVSADAVLPISS